MTESNLMLFIILSVAGFIILIPFCESLKMEHNFYEGLSIVGFVLAFFFSGYFLK